MHPSRRSTVLRRIAAATAVVALLAASGGAWAEERQGRDGRWEGRREGPRREAPRWGHGDIRRFHRDDFRHWRGGRWTHGPHLGRVGWWWVVGGAWYFYPTPVYPYPDPYIPPVVTPGPPSPGEPPAYYWYYCQSAQAYYPYVGSCPEAWVPVAPQAP